MDISKFFIMKNISKVSYLLCFIILLAVQSCFAQKETSGTRTTLKDISKRSYRYPEELGADFNELSNDVLVDTMFNADFKYIYKVDRTLNEVEQEKKFTYYIDLKKAAQVLGDRFIENKFIPTAKQQNKINIITQRYIDLVGSAYGAPFGPIQRLWHLASPTLLYNLRNDNYKKRTFAWEMLINMRDEAIVKAMIDSFQVPMKEKIREDNMYSLSNLDRDYCYVNVPNRLCPSKEELISLYENLVIPFLKKENLDNKN